jgi:zinc protease
MLKIFLILAVMCLCPLKSFASVDKTILDNGMTVLVQPMPSSEVVSIYAYVKAGSATEKGLLGTGVSHFVEHMLFKGTQRRGVGVIAKEVKALGGTINAATSLDYTIYTLDVPKGKFKEGLDIISDMLMNSTFDAGQVEKEREVVHGEMRLYKDRPERILSEEVFRNVYVHHPYRHPIIGYEKLFDQISRNDLYDYFRRHYVPNNIILSVAGAVTSVDVLGQIKSAFKEFKPLPYPDRDLEEEPRQISSRYMERFYATPLVRFSLAYQSVPLLDPDLFALDVLAMALGQGESSRLYTGIYKKGLVQEISCGNFTPEHKGVFEIEGVMLTDNLDKVRLEVARIIDDVKHTGLTAEELERTKRQVQSQFVFGNQTSSSLAHRAASDEALTGDPQFSKRYVEAIKNVTNEDIKRVARAYLIDSSLSVTVIKPESAAKAEQAKQQQEQLAGIEKVVLPNGLTILFKEDHSVGLIAIQAVANGGVRQEPVEKNGVSQLFAQIWVDEESARAMERRGGSAGGFAGRNCVGLSVQVLSEDTMFAIDMLKRLLANPSFSQKILEEKKQKVYAAIQAREDDVEDSAQKQLLETLFLKHPYRLDPLGTKETVSAITLSDIQNYYSKFIKAQNMVVSIFGDFDSKVVIPQLKAGLSNLAKGEKRSFEMVEPPSTKTRIKDIKTDKEQAVMMYGFQAPAIKNKERWAMETINAVLGAGLSGRLFVKVRDELGRAYTVGSHYVPGIDTGIFELFVLTTNDKIVTVKDILAKQLQEIVANPISDEELKSAKAYLKGTFKMALNTPAALGSMSAINELYGLGYDLHDKYEGYIDAVTKDDVKAVAAKYLKIDQAAIVISTGQDQ